MKMILMYINGCIGIILFIIFILAIFMTETWNVPKETLKWLLLGAIWFGANAFVQTEFYEEL